MAAAAFLRSSQRSAAAATLAAAGWWVYDMETGHKMRTMTHPAYSAEFLAGSATRFRNAVLGSAPLRPLLLPAFTPRELARYDGRAEGPQSTAQGAVPRPVYFALRGVVYDASSSEGFRDAYAQWAGRDATLALARMSLDPAEGAAEHWEDAALSEAELETAASWQSYFDERYPVVGSLRREAAPAASAPAPAAPAAAVPPLTVAAPAAAAAAAAAAVAAPVAAPAGPMPPPPPSSAALEARAAASRPAVFVYGADWCGYTRHQVDELRAALGAAGLGGALRVVECDKEASAVCAALKGYPLTVVHGAGVSPDPQELLRSGPPLGKRSAEAVLGELRAALAAHEASPDMRKRK